MKLKRLMILHGLALAMTLSHRAVALADSEITISPAGSGSFSVMGNLLDKVATLDITVEYDAGTLSNPAASCGPLAAAAHCEINTETSGIVQIRISSTTPLSGVGTVAALSFTCLGDEPGTINSLDARLTDSNGDPLTARVNVVNPSPGQFGRPAPKALKETEPDSTLPAPTPAGGAARQETSLAPTAVKATDSNAKQPAATALLYHRLESVLERFRGRPDAATLDSLLPLFESVHGGGISQVPPIVISDGGSKVRLTVELAGSIKTAPNFALRGAHLISMKSEANNTWVIEVLPDKGVYAASLMVLTDACLTEYPLTVSPQMEQAGGELGPADFIRWRKSRTQPKKAAGKDADRPGFVEDYIYAANYLAKKHGAAPTAAHP